MGWNGWGAAAGRGLGACTVEQEGAMKVVVVGWRSSEPRRRNVGVVSSTQKLV